jgi:hypothetical protein
MTAPNGPRNGAGLLTRLGFEKQIPFAYHAYFRARPLGLRKRNFEAALVRQTGRLRRFRSERPASAIRAKSTSMGLVQSPLPTERIDSLAPARLRPADKSKIMTTRGSATTSATAPAAWRS